MVRAAWLTDIHLDFLSTSVQERFFERLAAEEADCILLGGDVAHAASVAPFLQRLEEALQKPIYFVLGNHDFYHGSIARVRETMRTLCRQARFLHWLSSLGAVPVTAHTGLVGHDGWGDGRYGDYWRSTVELNDFRLIEELRGCDRRARFARLNALGDEAAAHLGAVLPEALDRFEHVVVLTHVPPFAEAAWHEGHGSDAHFLPFFACQCAGETLRRALAAHPGKRMTVLCGHTHGSGYARVTPGLEVFTVGAEYGAPMVQRIFEWE